MNKKKYAKTKLIIILVLVIIGLCFTVVSFDFPGGSSGRYLGFIGAINTSTELDSSYKIEFTVDRNNGEVSNADINEGVEEMYNIFQNFMLSFNDTKITRETRDGEEMVVAIVPGTELGSNFFTLFGEAKKLEVKHGDTVLLTNKNIKSASYTTGSSGYVVYVEFDTKGTRTLMKYSSEDLTYNIDDSSVQGTFSNNSYLLLSSSDISASASSASTMAIELLAGKLPYTMTVSMNSNVDALAGKNAKTLLLIGVGVVAVLYIVYMILKHKFMGLVTLLGGAIFVIVDSFILQSIPVTSMTLASYLSTIASFVVYVLACEYLLGKIEKDYEHSAGKRIDFSLKHGYKNSLLTLMDIHLVSLIFALSILVLGTKPIKAVSMTFICGIIISAFINFVLNKYFVKLLVDIYPTDAKKFNFTKGEITNEN